MFYGNYLTRIINFFLILIEAILGLRVLFRLFNANPTNAFVHWIYQTSSTLMEPFRGIFSVHEIGRGYTLDVSALFAMLMYAIIGTFLAYLLSLIPIGPADPATTKTRVVRK